MAPRRDSPHRWLGPWLALIHPHAILLHMSASRARARIRQATALVKLALREAPPEQISEPDAREMAALLGELAKVVTSGVVRHARRSGPDATGVLSTVVGTARGAARRTLQAAESIEAVPQLSEAFSNGEVSVDQATIIASAAADAPAAAGQLIEAARTSSLKELKLEAERARRRARPEHDQLERERSVHARRYCRTWVTSAGGVRVEALLGAVDGARLMAALDKETQALFRSVESAAQRETLCADALVDLVTGNARTAGAQVIVRVDAAALQRGSVEGSEVCEVDGVGPVSLSQARSLLGEGFCTLLVTKGTDVRTVTSTTRAIPRKVRMALALRDQTCVVPGCPATHNLEIDHWRTDFARSGPSELDNLCRLCNAHHKMKTRYGWRLLGGPGKWEWRPPRPRPSSLSPRATSLRR